MQVSSSPVLPAPRRSLEKRWRDGLGGHDTRAFGTDIEHAVYGSIGRTRARRPSAVPRPWVTGGMDIVGPVAGAARRCRPRSSGSLAYGVQLALQQLPEPTTPPLASQDSALDLVEQRSTTAGHPVLSVQAVTPSSQNPSVLQVPGLQVVQVTNPDLWPHVDRAAQRTTLPLQFTSSSPLRTASRTWRVMQLTYCPWLPVHGHSVRMRSRTVTRSGSLQPALAVDASRATAPISVRVSTIFLTVYLPCEARRE